MPVARRCVVVSSLHSKFDYQLIMGNIGFLATGTRPKKQKRQRRSLAQVLSLVLCTMNLI